MLIGIQKATRIFDNHPDIYREKALVSFFSGSGFPHKPQSWVTLESSRSPQMGQRRTLSEICSGVRGPASYGESGE